VSSDDLYRWLLFLVSTHYSGSMLKCRTKEEQTQVAPFGAANGPNRMERGQHPRVHENRSGTEHLSGTNRAIGVWVRVGFHAATVIRDRLNKTGVSNLFSSASERTCDRPAEQEDPAGRAASPAHAYHRPGVGRRFHDHGHLADLSVPRPLSITDQG
jgi:hypothetical protein